MTISTLVANETFGKYNALLARNGTSQYLIKVNSIVDFDPQDPVVYADD